MKWKRWNRRLMTISVAAVVLCGGATFAQNAGNNQGTDGLLDLLQRKGIINEQEAKQLKGELSKQIADEAAKSNKSKVPSWLEKIDWAGDFRLRFDELQPESGLGQADRLRYRVRLRYGGVWTPTDWATIGFRLGSGDGTPNTNNQTLTGAFSKKPVWIDAAYVTLQPPGWDWIKVTGGKMNNPIWQPAFNSPMIYDPDLTPEGLAEQLTYSFGPEKRFRVFGNAGQFVLNELKSDENDVYMFDSQAGIEAKFGDPKSPFLKATAVGGFLLTDNMRNMATAAGSGNIGNSVSGANYLSDFSDIYGRAEVAWKISEQPFLGAPALLTFSGEYDKNLDSTYENAPAVDPHQTSAWALQAMFGQAAKKHQWQVAYEYKHVEADSVFDSITDDDFGAGTDRQGHVIKAAYNIRDWWQIGLTAFLTEKISDRPNTGHNQVGIEGQQQVRVFLDTMFKF